VQARAILQGLTAKAEQTCETKYFDSRKKPAILLGYGFFIGDHVELARVQ
jgi:hypothetical protein